MKQYRAKRRALKRSKTGEPSLVEELERLLDLARNDRALDLTFSDATILLVCPSEGAGEMNTIASKKSTLARAKLIVLQVS